MTNRNYLMLLPKGNYGLKTTTYHTRLQGRNLDRALQTP